VVVYSKLKKKRKERDINNEQAEDLLEKLKICKKKNVMKMKSRGTHREAPKLVSAEEETE